MIDLTPKQIAYLEYLKTDIWAEKRAAAIKRDGGKCRLCNSSKNINVHHRKYPKVLGTESIEDLTTICRKCHELYHVKPISLNKPKKRRTKKERKLERAKRREAIKRIFIPKTITRKSIFNTITEDTPINLNSYR